MRPGGSYGLPTGQASGWLQCGGGEREMKRAKLISATTIVASVTGRPASLVPTLLEAQTPQLSLSPTLFKRVQVYIMVHHLEKTFDPEALAETGLQPSDTISVELAFPDGGFKAWLTVAGGLLAQISSIGFLSAFSVFQSYYGQVTLPNSSASDISWIGSLQIFGCFLLGIWSGRLSDKKGPKLPLTLGTFFMVFGTMMASISSTYYQVVLSQGVCSAIGFGMTFTPALAVQSQWFLKKRGLVVGLVMSGQNIGGG